MPSTPANAAQVLLLAPPEAVLAASGVAYEDDIVVPPGPASRRSTIFAVVLSLALHAGALALVWHWAAELKPMPERPVLQVRLRAGGGAPAPAPHLQPPPAPPEPVAAAPKPNRPPAQIPAPPPTESAKTATLPAAPPVVVAQEPRPELIAPTPQIAPDATQSGTDVVTPPVDPMVDTATVHVLEWLAQHRRYPGSARRERLQGTVEVVVVLMPDGRLVNQRIAQSSGHAILDKAALDLLRRASPVPMSAFFTGEARQLELRLPIIYRLSI